MHELVERQRACFRAGGMRAVNGRLDALRRLRAEIQHRENEIIRALNADLGKSGSESLLCEVGMVYSALGWLIRNLRRCAAPHRVRTPLSQFRAHSYTEAAPLGTVLVMSPWNYPFLLTVEPAAAAIAAGNTVVIKPSPDAPHTAKVLERLFAAVFEPEQAVVVTGGIDCAQRLLKERFDLIFYTGGASGGSAVARAAAEHLTPTVLELGGKSPCIVDADADLPSAARRIVFGKYLNCGQTCVAPDYLLVHESVRQPLIDLLEREIHRQFGAQPLRNPDYGRIVNARHYDRLCAMLDGGVLIGGARENGRIEPTVLEADEDSRCMQEEIFGPILPVLSWTDWEQARAVIDRYPTPLACYYFGNAKTARRRLRELSFGGGCINDTIMHLASNELPFGGVGTSGMGCYHGRWGFETFSHTKGIVDRKIRPELPMRYQPYAKWKDALVRRFLR